MSPARCRVDGKRRAVCAALYIHNKTVAVFRLSLYLRATEEKSLYLAFFL